MNCDESGKPIKPGYKKPLTLAQRVMITKGKCKRVLAALARARADGVKV